jgi:ABC-type transport system involved in cytochrome c biogenesis permease subunit
MPASPDTAQRRLYIAGLLVLILGLIAAAWVYATASADSGAGATGYTIVGGSAYSNDADSSAREMQQVERLGGTAAVLTLRLHRWLASLWHGRRLAVTLLVLATAIGLLCFHIAGLMGEDVDPR